LMQTVEMSRQFCIDQGVANPHVAGLSLKEGTS
jgi:hypothetical protein